VIFASPGPPHAAEKDNVCSIRPRKLGFFFFFFVRPKSSNSLRNAPTDVYHPPGGGRLPRNITKRR